MAEHKSIELTAVEGTSPQAQYDSAIIRGKVRRLRASFALASQASGDTLKLGKLPAGASLIAVAITSSVTLATATLAVGISGATDKYKAAGTHTAVDQPVLHGKASAKDDVALADAETLIATIGTAALPAAGQLVFDILYADRA
jgi:hypothetical protein